MFNNVAIAARHAQQTHGLRRCVRAGPAAGRVPPPLPPPPPSLAGLLAWRGGLPVVSPVPSVRRILIVDWDIHHGQGIQYTFEDDPR